MGDYQQMDDSKKPVSNNLRTVAFCAVVFSTVAITACLITFPLVFQHVQKLQSAIKANVDYCENQNSALWREAMQMGEKGEAQDAFVSRVTRQARQNCCCQEGPVGRPGSPGNPGSPGRPGSDGGPGGPGQDADMNAQAWLPDPPQCDCRSNPGPFGPPGRPGPPGTPGRPGNGGSRGRIGGKGQNGRPGNDGPPGPPGRPGNPGRDGQLRRGPPTTGPPGPNGRPGNPGGQGRQGDKGPDGIPGRDGGRGPAGRPGQPGRPGAAGQPGAPGGPGERGPCSQCPPPRLAPGY